MGNRGQLHNSNQQIIRPYKLKAWLTCLLHFKDRYRKVMTPNLYTELFFLDEATAFAAGHRPCFECRREAYTRFKTCWTQGNPNHTFSMKTSIKEIDNVMHDERMNADGSKKMYKATISSLPEGTFILMNNNAYLIANHHLYLWSAEGYTERDAVPTKTQVSVLTPPSVVNAFSAGYSPQISLPKSLYQLP